MTCPFKAGRMHARMQARFESSKIPRDVQLVAVAALGPVPVVDGVFVTVVRTSDSESCKNYLSRVRLSVESPAQTSLEACNTRMKCVQRALCVVGLIAVVPCRAAEQARAGTLPLRSCALALIPALFLPSTAALRDSMWCLPTGFHFSLLHKLTRHFLTPP